MNNQSLVTKNWTLLRYAVEINLSNSNSVSSIERQQPQRQIIDCSEGLLSLSLTATQQLFVIRDETEKIECVNLLSTDSSSIIATYTGDSLLISYLISNDHIQRKFLIKFASTTTQTGCQHCQECITCLSLLIHITHFDSTSSSLTNSLERTNSIVSITDIIKSFMGEDSLKLSNYYNQDLSFDSTQSNDFLEKYLCDETFPDFVATVASILDTLKNV